MISNTDLKEAALPAHIAAGLCCPAGFEFDIAHHVPGRLRLWSAALKGNACAIEQVRRNFAQISGVAAASANPTTGSVLLKYDPNVSIRRLPRRSRLLGAQAL
jgi:hypothetical protein